jgi:hypothetical protein
MLKKKSLLFYFVCLFFSRVQYKTKREEVKPVGDPGGNATEVSVTTAMTTMSEVPSATHTPPHHACASSSVVGEKDGQSSGCTESTFLSLPLFQTCL